MDFKYDPKTERLKSIEDETIYLTKHGIKRELGGWAFIFHVGDMRIGFTN